MARWSSSSFRWQAARLAPHLPARMDRTATGLLGRLLVGHSVRPVGVGQVLEPGRRIVCKTALMASAGTGWVRPGRSTRPNADRLRHSSRGSDHAHRDPRCRLLGAARRRDHEPTGWAHASGSSRRPALGPRDARGSLVRLPEHQWLCCSRRRSWGTPSPVSSSSTTGRPTVASAIASPVPCTSGPLPFCQSTSVATSRRPLM